MLVLSRKRGDRTVIQANGDIITIEVLILAGNRVSIGVDAPSHVRVLRQELLEHRPVQRQATAPA